jgi:hypothetical protein
LRPAGTFAPGFRVLVAGWEETWMAAGQSAAELGRFPAGRADGLVAAAVLLADRRDAGEDLLRAVAGPAKVAKWPVPERSIPSVGEQRAGARQARGGPCVGVSPGWAPGAGTDTELARGAGGILTPGAGDEPGRCGPGRSPVPLHLPRRLLAVAFVLALIPAGPGGHLKEARCATASSQRG